MTSMAFQSAGTQAEVDYSDIPTLFFFAASIQKLATVKSIYMMTKSSNEQYDVQPLLPFFKEFIKNNYTRHRNIKNCPVEAMNVLCDIATGCGLETLDDLARQLNEEREEELLSIASKGISCGENIATCSMEDIRDMDDIALEGSDLLELFIKYVPNEFRSCVEKVFSIEPVVITSPSQRLHGGSPARQP